MQNFKTLQPKFKRFHKEPERFHPKAIATRCLQQLNRPATCPVACWYPSTGSLRLLDHNIPSEFCRTVAFFTRHQSTTEENRFVRSPSKHTGRVLEGLAQARQSRATQGGRCCGPLSVAITECHTLGQLDRVEVYSNYCSWVGKFKVRGCV